MNLACMFKGHDWDKWDYLLTTTILRHLPKVVDMFTKKLRYQERTDCRSRIRRCQRCPEIQIRRPKV